jgi:hypothetical protein
MDADRISERRHREFAAHYLRPFVARPTKHELYDFAGSTFGEVGSIRGWFCFGLFSVSLADVAKGADGAESALW